LLRGSSGEIGEGIMANRETGTAKSGRSAGAGANRAGTTGTTGTTGTAGKARSTGRSGKTKAGAGTARLKWTRERRETFFAELSELCNIAAAARAVGISDTKIIYRTKKRDPVFAADFERAVDEGYERLDLEMLERARFGEGRPADVGVSGARQREIPTGLALQLLRLHQARGRGRSGAALEAMAAAPAGPARPKRGRLSLRAEIEARLSELNRRFGGEG
jgi:hypothetical protein